MVGVVGVVLVLLLAGGVGYTLVGQGSGGSPSGGASPSVNPELSDPTTVVHHWLKAMFVLKDPDEMLKYTCKKEADRAKLADTVDTVKKAEKDAKDADLAMKVTWSKPSEQSREDTKATVKATITVVVGKNTQKTPANFDLVFESGWKVCDAGMT